ncbi:MAG: serine/threonine protein phosphatase [Sphingopyxis sp.]|nr:serine/threonine protein phosphatase [Sphingopyxis sp.]
MSLFRLFKPRPVQESPVLARIPAGERVYAIGDIHGCDDLFADLLAKIVADNANREPARTTLVLLGDLVDRGPQSAAVVQRAIGLGAPFDAVRLLIGNHEECFLAALSGDRSRVRYFFRIGGDTTIRSYWGDDESYDSACFDELAEGLAARVPPEHIDFIRRGEDMIRIGDYVFVHAGVRPGTTLERQRRSDLRWIREDFLNSEGGWPGTVVHGHTITEAVDFGANRIGIDTGAYASGTLTAIGLSGAEQWFLST